MYSVYAIQSNKDNRIYVGMSKNPDGRIKMHNAGGVISTKPYRPWQKIYDEKVCSSYEARAREKFLKSGQEKEFLKSIMPR